LIEVESQLKLHGEQIRCLTEQSKNGSDGLEKSGLPDAIVRQKAFDKRTVNRKLCFVLMPFDTSFDSVYRDIIKRTVESFSLECKRADELFGIKPIMSDIWDYIQKTGFLIADLTSRNPNVFYELGLAHAFGKEVILITQNIEDVPFDLRHYRCVVYENSIRGASKLECGLKGTIRDLLKKNK
jgi:hypothetical protein